jgi:hypothetical protein
MKTFFKNLSIQKIEFQSNNPEVSLWCSHEIDDQIIESELIIDQSELNRLVGKIQQITQKMDFFNSFKQAFFQNELVYYFFDIKHTDYKEIIIPILEGNSVLRQICA